MTSILRLVKSPLKLQHQYADPLEQQQARGILRMSWVAILTLIAIAVFQFGDSTPAQHSFSFANLAVTLTDGAYAAIYILSAALLLVAVALVNRGELASARAAFVAALLTYTVLFYLFTGPMSFTLFALSIPLVAAGVLFNRRGVLIVALGLLFFLAVMNLFYRIGVITFTLARPFTLTELLLVSLIVLLFDVLLLAVFAGGQRVLLARNLILTNELHSLTVISRTIASGSTVEEILTQLIDLTRDQLGYYHAQVFLLDEKTKVITLIAGSGLIDAAQRRISPDAPGVVGEVLRAGQSRRLTLDSPAELRTEFLPATRAQLLVPLRRGERILGVLDVQSLQHDAFTAQDIDALEGIASQIAIALENVRYADSLRAAEQMRDELLEQNRTLTRERARLDQELSGRAWVDYMQSRSDRLIGYDMKDGVITLNPNPLSVTPDSLHPRIEMRDGSQALIVPITTRGQVFGVMEFTASQGETWDDRSIELARAISQRLALTLDNLRLFEQAQLAVAREQMANQVATILQTRGDIDSLVNVAVEAFQHALSATKTSIRLGIPDDAPAGALNPGEKQP